MAGPLAAEFSWLRDHERKLEEERQQQEAAKAAQAQQPSRADHALQRLLEAQSTKVPAKSPSFKRQSSSLTGLGPRASQPGSREGPRPAPALVRSSSQRSPVSAPVGVVEREGLRLPALGVQNHPLHSLTPSSHDSGPPMQPRTSLMPRNSSVLAAQAASETANISEQLRRLREQRRGGGGTSLQQYGTGAAAVTSAPIGVLGPRLSRELGPSTGQPPTTAAAEAGVQLPAALRPAGRPIALEPLQVSSSNASKTATGRTSPGASTFITSHTPAAEPGDKEGQPLGSPHRRSPAARRSSQLIIGYSHGAAPGITHRALDELATDGTEEVSARATQALLKDRPAPARMDNLPRAAQPPSPIPSGGQTPVSGPDAQAAGGLSTPPQQHPHNSALVWDVEQLLEGRTSKQVVQQPRSFPAAARLEPGMLNNLPRLPQIATSAAAMPTGTAQPGVVATSPKPVRQRRSTLADGYLMHMDSKRGIRRQTSMTGEASSSTTTPASASGPPGAGASSPSGVPQLGRVYSSKFAASMLHNLQQEPGTKPLPASSGATNAPSSAVPEPGADSTAATHSRHQL